MRPNVFVWFSLSNKRHFAPIHCGNCQGNPCQNLEKNYVRAKCKILQFRFISPGPKYFNLALTQLLSLKILVTSSSSLQLTSAIIRYFSSNIFTFDFIFAIHKKTSKNLKYMPDLDQPKYLKEFTSIITASRIQSIVYEHLQIIDY